MDNYQLTPSQESELLDRVAHRYKRTYEKYVICCMERLVTELLCNFPHRGYGEGTADIDLEAVYSAVSGYLKGVMPVEKFIFGAYYSDSVVVIVNDHIAVKIVRSDWEWLRADVYDYHMRRNAGYTPTPTAVVRVDRLEPFCDRLIYIRDNFCRWRAYFEKLHRPASRRLFATCNDTIITSCIQGVMGQVYLDNRRSPKSAFAYAGCFGFLAGEPDESIFYHRPVFLIAVPLNEAWAEYIEKKCPKAKKITRYAMKKDTCFDREKLKRYASSLPEGYELKKIDIDLHDRCFEKEEFRDFVAVFEDCVRYMMLGRGVVVLKNGEIVAGASSYTRYVEGIEIEVDTLEEERRKGLATAACARLILDCLDEGLYPSWDAANLTSVHLAEKLGYEFDHEYTAYEIDSMSRPE